VTDRDAIIKAGAKALAADRGLDLDNLEAHADPGDSADDLAAWRANWIDDGRIAYDAMAGLIATAAVEQLRAAVLAACDQIEDAYAGQFREGATVDLGLIRAAIGGKP
jgi:hypothetical protein